MLRDITIGQYYPSNSFIHRLDPRTKLFGTMIFLISLFVTSSVLAYAVATVFLVFVIYKSRVPFGYMVKGLKAIIMLLMFSVVFTLFLTPGKEIFSWWIFTLTVEGIEKSGFIAVRLIYLILGSTIMTLTTTPNDLADGLEKAFRPLTHIRVPVHEIAMMMSIAFRFIPILLEETDKIMKAQMARGADFESGGLIKKAKGLIPLIVPLVVSAIKRAMDLATAMEARCYQGGVGRTKMKPLHYEKMDYLVYITFVIYLGIMIATKFVSI